MADESEGETRSERKRAAILRAATTAFRDEGYESTSMDRIAALAGVSKRTVYNHFGGKEALLGAVFEHHLARLASRARVDWEPARPLTAQLRAFARAKLATLEDPVWTGLLRVALGVFMHHPDLVRETALRASRSDDALVSWLRAASAAGRVRVDDRERAAAQFWALIKGELFWPVIFGVREPPTPAQRDAVIDGAIELFLERYGAERPATGRGAS
ncbi:MAG: TetR/AcrR family transcriptional regulator [Myxococcales bacterium]|nr:TetR/AcrR family transcriptional regulator [Myxococcales bacterium]